MANFVALKFRFSPIEPLKKLIRHENSLTYSEIDRALWGVLFIVALIGLMTVDFAFFKNYGIRLSAVLGIAFARILYVLIFLKK